MTKLRSIRNLFVAAVFVAAISQASFAGVFVSVSVAPPPLLVYSQPPCPGDGFIWTPGYWAYGPDGYYWVRGAWVLAPTPGFLWTPGYWGFAGGVYAWHAGYWGPHVGFYGGINYGFGYTGVGFAGGMWVGGHFSYNTAVTNVNTTIVRNTYVNNTVVNNNTTINRTSFNGPGGVTAQPTATERAAAREQHVAPTSAQNSREQASSMNRGRSAMNNEGNNRGANTMNERATANHSNANPHPESFRSSNPHAAERPAMNHPGPAFRGGNGGGPRGHRA